ncbi:DUF1844 domain-containing protein [Granulicella arctica]|uniref:DUF1844 domain-containing protein n=1 Tax=Granulicella arctica TaxID=940613 RepID=UPI0021DFE3D1|nr:DUF1844 domain-containing protein [Granulicella arctica]
MSEQNKPFVVTDRRKFTLDGEPRPDADPSPEREPRPEHAIPSGPEPVAAPTPISAADDTPGVEPPATDQQEDLPPALTPEQTSQAKFAYEQTADRLDVAIRAANPGMDHLPQMTFDGLVQSVYMTAVMQLGGNTPEGEQPRVDLMGARQSIDMLAVLEDKTANNLSEAETRLLESAIFELRVAFLEVTQALSRSAASKAQGTPGRPGQSGPSIVR